MEGHLGEIAPASSDADGSKTRLLAFPSGLRGIRQGGLRRRRVFLVFGNSGPARADTSLARYRRISPLCRGNIERQAERLVVDGAALGHLENRHVLQVALGFQQKRRDWRSLPITRCFWVHLTQASPEPPRAAVGCGVNNVTQATRANEQKARRRLICVGDVIGQERIPSRTAAI